MKKQNFFCIFKIVIIFIFIALIILFNFFFVNKIGKVSHKNNKKYIKYEKGFNGNSSCHLLDPIQIFDLRLKNGPIEICNEKNSKHICYINHEGYYNNIFYYKNGVICTMENIILDPFKLKKINFIYNGPVDHKNKGSPILSKGFINSQCSPNQIDFKYISNVIEFMMAILIPGIIIIILMI